MKPRWISGSVGLRRRFSVVPHESLGRALPKSDFAQICGILPPAGLAALSVMIAGDYTARI